MDDKPYEPEVDDYVVWERETWVGKMVDEGWVYFKGDPIEPKKGFATQSRYITIETHVRDKPKCQQTEKDLHHKIHCLLLCYESEWKNLRFVKRRKSKNCQHYSQYDDVNND